MDFIYVYNGILSGEFKCSMQKPADVSATGRNSNGDLTKIIYIVCSVSHSKHIQVYSMSTFEPSSILALLASLELPKDKKGFEEEWKTKVSPMSAC
jgi:hypothetical protein